MKIQEVKLNAAEQELKKAQMQLDEKEKELDAAMQEYNAAMSEKQQLMDDAEGTFPFNIAFISTAYRTFHKQNILLSVLLARISYFFLLNIIITKVISKYVCWSIK